MYRQELGVMKAIGIAFMIMMATVLSSGCAPTEMKTVESIDVETITYQQEVMVQEGGNAGQRAGGGALIGGVIGYALGGPLLGAAIGAAGGAATTSEPKLKTYTETIIKHIYTIHFDDGSKAVRNDYCPLYVGQSVRKSFI